MEIKPYARRAQYYETDQMGVIHHSNYIRWFEEARVDFMEQAGFGYAKLEERGVGSPVLGVQCSYKSMVRFGDQVRVCVRVESITGAKMTISYRVEDAATGELRATGETRHCFLGPEGKPISLLKDNQDVYQLFAQFVDKTAI